MRYQELPKNDNYLKWREISILYLPPPGESSLPKETELSAIHRIISKHISIVIGAGDWCRPERSHIAGSSLELGLVALLGLVLGTGTPFAGGENGALLCVGEGLPEACGSSS